MGDWHHSPHFTEAAKAFARRTRIADIAVFMEDCMPRLRDVSRLHGYALTVHGSLARDLDVVAVPWVEKAGEPDALLEAIRAACREMTGWGHVHGDAWEAKPHGRMARTIIASSDVHLDLSVMPRAPKPEEPDE